MLMLMIAVVKLAHLAHDLGQHWKPLLGVVCAFLAAVGDGLPGADAFSQVEDLTVKGILAFIAWVCWSGWQKDRKAGETKAEASEVREQALRDKHEQFMKDIIQENTRSNLAVVNMVQRQVKYFDDITEKVMNQHITHHGTPWDGRDKKA